MTVDRRTFLRGLVAAALATQIPLPAEAEIDRITDHIMAMRNFGVSPEQVSIWDIRNGWLIQCKLAPPGSEGMHMDFTGMNDGMGLCMADEEHAEEMMAKHDFVFKRFDFNPANGVATMEIYK